jgi:hypothetical protein
VLDFSGFWADAWLPAFALLGLWFPSLEPVRKLLPGPSSCSENTYRVLRAVQKIGTWSFEPVRKLVPGPSSCSENTYLVLRAVQKIGTWSFEPFRKSQKAPPKIIPLKYQSIIMHNPLISPSNFIANKINIKNSILDPIINIKKILKWLLSENGDLQFIKLFLEFMSCWRNGWMAGFRGDFSAFPNCQNFPFQTVKFPFSNCQISLFQNCSPDSFVFQRKSHNCHIKSTYFPTIKKQT